MRILAGLCVLLIAACLSPVRAAWPWEFTIDSALVNFRFIYASQAGSNGFFGPFDMDMSSTGGDYASVNGWFQRRTLSGSTALTSSTRFLVFPNLKFNPALSVKGVYRVQPENTQDPNPGLLPELDTPFSRGEWTRLWVTANTPVGKILYGKRGFQQGCGLQFGNAEIAEDLLDVSRRTVEIFQIESAYGPMTIGWGFYPWRRGSSQYWNFEDQKAARTTHLLAYAQYTAGSMDAGFGGFYWFFDEGPESRLRTAQRLSTPPATTWGSEGWIYFKYFNGRLFLNGEADWRYGTTRYQASQNGTFNGDPAVPFPGGGSRFAPNYVESWRYMLEFGGLSGPAKLSVLLCHMPGPDRRHGVLIDRQPIIQEPEKSAYGVFYPYSLLMAKYYRAGIDSYRDLSAANTAAAQLCYMPAANLDALLSVTFAQRSSHGYGYGYIRPNPRNPRNLDFDNRGTFADPSPSIPSIDLGWELDLGFAWRLLENWELTFRTAYWRPGRWFNYACIDRSVANWNNPSSANNWGVNPDRPIDPIFGIELYLNAKL